MSTVGMLRRLLRVKVDGVVKSPIYCVAAIFHPQSIAERKHEVNISLNLDKLRFLDGYQAKKPRAFQRLSMPSNARLLIHEATGN